MNIGSGDLLRKRGISAIAGNIQVFLELEGLIDIEQEIEKLTKEIEGLKKDLKAKEARLGNKEFIKKAPFEIVEKEKELLTAGKEKLTHLNKIIYELKNKLSEYTLRDLIRNALKEDIGAGDITTELLIPRNKVIKAVIILKEKAVVAGLEITQRVFKTIDKNIQFKAISTDGSWEKSGKIIAKVEGRLVQFYPGERTALNFLSHLSGVATVTRSFVNKVKPYKARIMDTRKTIPGLRELEKYAVALGGRITTGWGSGTRFWSRIITSRF